MTRTLDQTLLRELHRAWQKQGAEIADVLAPGLSDDEIDGLTEPLGLRLPIEARTWWGWHNGVTVETPRGWDIGPDIGFYSLTRAIDELQAEPLGGGGKPAPPTWFPFAQAPGGWLVLDRAHPKQATVHRVDVEVGFYPGADSMGEMVALWIDVIRSGAWSWDSSKGRWNHDLGRKPARAENMYVI